MLKHLQQAQHNQDFLDTLINNTPNNYFDWKITVCFYIALHYLKALAAQKGIDIGESHEENFKSINPDRAGNNMPIKKHAFKNYKNLRNYAHKARYEGYLLEASTQELVWKRDYEYALQELDDFKKYISAQGIVL